MATRQLKNFDDMFIRFDTTHKRDRQTLHDDIGRAYASHRMAMTEWEQNVINEWINERQ